MRLQPDMSRTLLAIGDTHLYRPGVSTGVSNAANERASNYRTRVLALGEPAGVLHIGDITEDGRPEEYVDAVAWWSSFPDPKIICAGNHDIDVGFGSLPEWEAAFGLRNQVLEAEHFRVVSCLWAAGFPAIHTHALNTSEGRAALNDLVGGSTKPTALAFHYPIRDAMIGGGADGITAYAQDSVKQLVDNHDNLQLVLTGHTHSRPWTAHLNSDWTFSGVTGFNGRKVHHQNLSATTYVSDYGNLRSPLPAYFLSFYDDRFEVRIREIKSDTWMTRAYGPAARLVEDSYPYT